MGLLRFKPANRFLIESAFCEDGLSLFAGAFVGWVGRWGLRLFSKGDLRFGGSFWLGWVCNYGTSHCDLKSVSLYVQFIVVQYSNCFLT